MKKIVRIVAIVVTLLMLCAATVGCNFRRPDSDDGGGNGGGGNTGGGSVQEEYEINFNLPVGTTAEISVAIPDNDYERKIMNAAITGFAEKYPNIKVNLEPFDLNSYNTIIPKQFEAEMLADVVWCNSQNFYFIVSNGYALNLDVFTQQAEEAFVFDYDADFDSEFQAMGVYGGVRYSVPRSVDSVVCFYNKDILSKAGVDMSIIQNGWTWDDMLSVCAKVRAYYDGKGQTTYFPLDANLGWESVSYPIIKSLGGQVLNEQGEFALTEGVSEKVVSLVQNLVTNKYIPQGSEQTSNFESGTGALLFQSTAIENYQLRASLKDKFDIVSFPLINGEDSAIGMGYAGYFINSQLKDQADQLNAAAAFMAYLMSYDGQQQLAAEGGLTLPSIRTDLGTENAEANWHKKYSSQFNVEAYLWGSQYKTSEDFLNYTKAIFSASLISAVNTYVGSYAIKAPDKAYKYFREEVEYAFDSVV